MVVEADKKKQIKHDQLKKFRTSAVVSCDVKALNVDSFVFSKSVCVFSFSWNPVIWKQRQVPSSMLS